MNPQGGCAKGARVNHLRVGWVLLKRDILGSLLSPAFYIAVTAACLLSTFLFANYLDTLNKVTVMVSVDPSSIPLFFAVALMALYLGVTSSISITGEREHRTLEVLLYGPVTAGSVVLSKFFRDLAIFLFGLVFFTVYLIVVSAMTNLALGPRSFWSIATSFFLVWPMISFSVFLSAALRRVRSAVLLFIGVFLGLAGVQIASSLLLHVPPESISLFLLYVREALVILSRWLQWVSPFSYIARTTMDMTIGVSRSAGWYVLIAFLYSSLLLVMAVLVLKKRGVCG